jgi:hypothetical protein
MVVCDCDCDWNPAQALETGAEDWLKKGAENLQMAKTL